MYGLSVLTSCCESLPLKKKSVAQFLLRTIYFLLRPQGFVEVKSTGAPPGESQTMLAHTMLSSKKMVKKTRKAVSLYHVVQHHRGGGERAC
jgi:hypothetical protein